MAFGGGGGLSLTSPAEFSSLSLSFWLIYPRHWESPARFRSPMIWLWAHLCPPSTLSKHTPHLLCLDSFLLPSDGSST